MGNCLRSEKASMVRAGDDWGPLQGSKTKTQHNRMYFGGDDHDSTNDPVNQRLLHGVPGASSSSSSFPSYSSSSREVKIQITKKQLHQLLGRAGERMQGLTVEQFLSQLMINSGGGGDLQHHHHPFGVLDHQRSWRPGLQSIPEVN